MGAKYLFKDKGSHFQYPYFVGAHTEEPCKKSEDQKAPRAISFQEVSN